MLNCVGRFHAQHISRAQTHLNPHTKTFKLRLDSCKPAFKAENTQAHTCSGTKNGRQLLSFDGILFNILRYIYIYIYISP